MLGLTAPGCSSTPTAENLSKIRYQIIDDCKDKPLAVSYESPSVDLQASNIVFPLGNNTSTNFSNLYPEVDGINFCLTKGELTPDPDNQKRHNVIGELYNPLFDLRDQMETKPTQL